MSRISDVFQLNGINMPTPDAGGIAFNTTPIWAKNAKRSASGLYVGDIVADKRTVDITISNLTSSEIKLIEDQLTAYYTLTVIDPHNPSERITIECYKPPFGYTLRRIAHNGQFDTITLNCIER